MPQGLVVGEQGGEEEGSGELGWNNAGCQPGSGSGRLRSSEGRGETERRGRRVEEMTGSPQVHPHCTLMPAGSMSQVSSLRSPGVETREGP